MPRSPKLVFHNYKIKITNRRYYSILSPMYAAIRFTRCRTCSTIPLRYFSSTPSSPPSTTPPTTPTIHIIPTTSIFVWKIQFDRVTKKQKFKFFLDQAHHKFVNHPHRTTPPPSNTLASFNKSLNREQTKGYGYVSPTTLDYELPKEVSPRKSTDVLRCGIPWNCVTPHFRC